MMTNDLALVEQVAREMVGQHGAGAAAYLMDQAEIAEDIGDADSARACLDILGIAKDLI